MYPDLVATGALQCAHCRSFLVVPFGPSSHPAIEERKKDDDVRWPGGINNEGTGDLFDIVAASPAAAVVVVVKVPIRLIAAMYLPFFLSIT